MPQPITSPLLNGAYQNFNTRFERARKAKKVWWQRVASRIQSTTTEELYAWLQQVPKMRRWTGPRKIHRMGENALRVRNEKFEWTMGVKAEHLEDDRLGMYMGAFAQAGGQVAKFPDQQLAALIIANSTCWDGKAMFATDHPVDANNVDAGTFDNARTGLTFNKANFQAAYAAFMAIKGEDGEPLGLEPNRIIAPPLLRADIMEVLVNGTVASNNAAIGNVNAGLVDPIIIPELGGETTRDKTWYLAYVEGGEGEGGADLSPLIYQDRVEGAMVKRFNAEDPSVFENDEFIFGIRKRAAFAFGLPQLMMRCIGS